MTMHGGRVFGVGVLFLAGLAACTSSPVSPSGSVTVTTAAVASPANGALIPNGAQPITLTINDALVTGAAATVTYRFEVATDTLFTAKVVTKDVSQTAGQTSLTLSLLPAGQYYWHVRTTDADTPGVFTAPLTFTVGAAVTLQAPIPVSPLTGTTTTGWPLFTVIDVARTGPTSSLVYRFDIATDAAFSAIILSATVPETPGQTSFVPTRSQTSPTQPTLYWRATAIDQANFVSSPVSAIQVVTFVPLWPGAQPPGVNGHAVLGTNWQTQTVTSFTMVTFTSPVTDALQVFDLLDRGFDPQGAINWMHDNGYPTMAIWVPAVSVIGFQFEYMALIGGQWNLVFRVGS